MSIIASTTTPSTLLLLPQPPSWHHRVLPGGGFVSDVTDGDTAEVHLAGEIDVHDREALSAVLATIAMDPDVRIVTVVADAVDFIDLRALRAIEEVRDRLRRRGGELRLDGLHGVFASAWTYATTADPLPAPVVAC